MSNSPQPPAGRSRASLVKRVRIEAHAVWLAARDSRTPWHARVLGLLIAAYALSPIDLIPDFIPVLGLADDVLIIPAGIWLFEKTVPPALMQEHREAAAAAAERPTSIAGILIVIGIWIAAALLALTILRWAYD
jgi:uncharacterized membrane protein YkvA (DUF1232 family)